MRLMQNTKAEECITNLLIHLSQVSPCFTKPSAFADAALTHTQSPVQTQAQSQSQIHVPGLPAARRAVHVRTDASRPTPAPAAQVRPITRAEPCAKPVAVASGVTTTASSVSVPAQRAKAEAAASAAPEPAAPVRNVGQKVKEEPPSPVVHARSPLAKACVEAEEKVSLELSSGRVTGPLSWQEELAGQLLWSH